MKVIIDDKIPYIRESIAQIADEVVYLPGDKFTRQAVSDADALIIRTRTRCDRELLEGSQVRFIATATIGYDHINTHYCDQAGIRWTNAPGSNSGSVAQYIESCLILLETAYNFDIKGKNIGIIGVGNVGSKVQVVAESLGMRVLLNDPPRAEVEKNIDFTDIAHIVEQSDIITFHTPLYKEGKYKTLHLADDAFFRSLARKPVIINTARGEIVKTDALLRALDDGLVSSAIIDVWENEPDIDHRLLEKAILSTPHIAGYSADGKANATRMSLESLCDFFGITARIDVNPPLPENNRIVGSSMNDALIKIYDPRIDSENLRQHPERFEWLRGNYPLRREKQAFEIVLE